VPPFAGISNQPEQHQCINREGNDCDNGDNGYQREHGRRRFRMNTTHCSLGALLAVTLCSSTACVVVPVRAPELTRNAAGTNEHLDFSFLKAGAATRSDVTKNLGAIDSGANEPFFWGRWQSSKWYVVTGTLGAGGGDRQWRVHNVLIQFDSKDLVREWEMVGSKDLDSRLDSLDGHNANLVPVPARLSARLLYARTSGLLALQNDSLEYHFEDRGSTDLITPRSNIEKVTSHDMVDSSSGSSVWTSDTQVELHATLHFRVPVEVHNSYKNKNRTSKAKRLDIMLNPRDYLALRRYFRQTKAGGASN